jgi:hypothetical protein
LLTETRIIPENFNYKDKEKKRCRLGRML